MTMQSDIAKFILEIRELTGITMNVMPMSPDDFHNLVKEIVCMENDGNKKIFDEMGKFKFMDTMIVRWVDKSEPRGDLQ